jgi:hypothetical protein
MVVVAPCGLPLTSASAQTRAPLTPADARAIAEETYIFGIVVVEHYKAIYV